jgi:UDP-N-acetylmuramoylalanine--D-glutamate ligase
MDLELDWQTPAVLLDEEIERSMVKRSWQGQKVVIVGAARQGIALARYLPGLGARVVLTDRRQADELKPAQLALAGLDIHWELGGHPSSLLDDADLVCVSGGVPLDLPLLVEAHKRGLPVTNDSQIFFEEVTCHTAGITGSAGKTTTTSLLGEMARTAQQSYPSAFPYQQVWVGGNIGNPLINELDRIQPDDLAVVELSSFQLELMTVSPRVAAILNITPNHLDRHGNMQAYTEAKAHILDYQRSGDIAILNREDPGAWDLRWRVQGKLVTFGVEQPAPSLRGTFLRDSWLCYQGEGLIEPILKLQDIQLRGAHNLSNVLAACAIARSLEMPVQAMRTAVGAFRGVAHRLEYVRSWGGAAWYNDSIATAPERAMAAIRSFNEPIVLIAGGRDKDLPWEEFARLAVGRVRVLVLFGEAAGLIEQAILAVRGHQSLILRRSERLAEAVETAAGLVRPGDVVLLSPGGTSYDEFKDFEERGECYRKWVMAL